MKQSITIKSLKIDIIFVKIFLKFYKDPLAGVFSKAENLLLATFVTISLKKELISWNSAG